jgi:hypothetical protein
MITRHSEDSVRSSPWPNVKRKYDFFQVVAEPLIPNEKVECLSRDIKCMIRESLARMLGLKSKVEQMTNRAIVSGALVQASLADSWHDLRGISTPEHRLGDPAWAKTTDDPSGRERIKNLCVFVIYSSEPSLSTLSYLQALNNAGLEILAINNKRTSEGFLAKLKPLCWRVYNRLNIGRDIGAYKDGIMCMYEEGYLQSCRFLCLANDSMQFVPGRNGEVFTSEIAQFMREGTGALFTHQSHQIDKHFQSFFQILDRNIVNSRQFHRFWRRYRPLSHREHCIHRGELRLSKNVYNNITNTKVLYTTDALLVAIRSIENGQSATVDQIMGIMPSIARTKQSNENFFALDQLTAAALERRPIDTLCEHYLSELIESSNPSHTAAFLYCKYLQCPLIKHDICLAGSFSIGKAVLLFNEALLQAGIEPEEREARNQEFRTLLNLKGIPADYKSRPIQKALKGVTRGFTYNVD